MACEKVSRAEKLKLKVKRFGKIYNLSLFLCTAEACVDKGQLHPR